MKKLLYFLGAIFAFGFISQGLTTCGKIEFAPQSQPPAPQPVQLAPADALKKMTVAIRTGDMGEANRLFRDIPKDSPEYKKAQALYDEWRAKKAKADKDAARIAKRIGAVNRKKFAKEYERQLLDKGMDAYVSTQGKESSTLKIKWVLVSRPLVHKMINDENVVENLRSLGFTKLVMSDGYDSSWTIDLK
ncbi:hypothetical protein [Geobacter benzoatilyticus]|uniref:Lipoprotein n=1 Tax=Geobacter benzoatilyticus TaxID=2815309 RepID=A0ABX7Q1A2_9BACT|nr:hypothetical protein [Geobacter benzoatilyticus]QSV44915.1 hypothetical protein JZM60_12235 [Geobacter benzoatilyticus]